MRKIRSLLAFLCLLSMACVLMYADEDWVIETRLFKATKLEGAAKPGSPIIITTFSAPVMISDKGSPSASARDEDSVSAMKTELEKIYHSRMWITSAPARSSGTAKRKS